MLQRRCSLGFSRFRIYPGIDNQSSAGSGYIQLQTSRVQDISSFRYPGFTVVRYIQGSSRSGYIQGSSRSGYIQVQIFRVQHGQFISRYRYPGFSIVMYIQVQISRFHNGQDISRYKYLGFTRFRIYPGIDILGSAGSGYYPGIYIQCSPRSAISTRYPELTTVRYIQGSPGAGFIQIQISKVHHGQV